MKDFFLRNLALKVLSLFLALILFVLVREDRVAEFVLEVPVSVASVPENTVLVEPPPSRLRVRIRGRWSKILGTIEQERAPYLLDLRERNNGDDILYFEQHLLQQHIGQSGVDVIDVEPRSARIRLEPKVTRQVRIRPDVTGEPARGYVVARERIQVTPAFVVVRGPDSEVQAVEEILTRPISISGLAQGISRPDVLLRPPSGGGLLSLEPPRVEVRIPLEPIQTSRSLARVPIEVRGCGGLRACALAPGTASIQLVGPMLAIEALEAHNGAGLLWVDAAALSVEGGEYEDVPIVFDREGDVMVSIVSPESGAVKLQVTELRPAEADPDVTEPPPESPPVDADGGAGPASP